MIYRWALSSHKFVPQADINNAVALTANAGMTALVAPQMLRRHQVPGYGVHYIQSGRLNSIFPKYFSK